MPFQSVYVSNARSALRVVQAASAMSKTISGTAIVAKSDSAFSALNKDTEVLLVQVYNNDIFMSLHGETPPTNANAIQLVAGTIVELSRSQWLQAIFIRVSADAVLTALQLRGT